MHAQGTAIYGPAAPDAEFQALVRKTYAGNSQAMTALGARLLVGRESPYSPVDGEALLAEAARQGNAEAWRYIAVIAAAGVGREQSWGDAFDALARAADLHDAHAAWQLEMLRTMAITTPAQVERWLSAATATTVSEAPRLVAYARFLTPALCAYFIERARPKLVRAKVYDYHRGELKVDQMRTNSGTPFSLIETDVVIQLVRARIAHAAGVAVQQLEPLEVLHYSVGERYSPHIDFFHPDLPNYKELTALKGQRAKTCLVYLNEDYDGGETDFPKIGVKFRGPTGEALIFDNVLPDGTGDLRTVHTGTPPTRGEKWLLSQWIRDKAQRTA